MPHRPTHIAPTCPTGTNACGRLLRVDDGTGYQIFAYDRLGNVAENIRAIALPFEDSVYNFRMLYEYDSWNRVQRIVYPDSEVVSYNYDLAGNPCCGGFDVIRFAIERFTEPFSAPSGLTDH